jgi:hypothetical protein
MGAKTTQQNWLLFPKKDSDKATVLFGQNSTTEKNMFVQSFTASKLWIEWPKQYPANLEE